MIRPISPTCFLAKLGLRQGRGATGVHGRGCWTNDGRSASAKSTRVRRTPLELGHSFTRWMLARSELCNPPIRGLALPRERGLAQSCQKPWIFHVPVFCKPTKNMAVSTRRHRRSLERNSMKGKGLPYSRTSSWIN